MNKLIGMTDLMLGDEWEGLDESNFIMLMEYAKFLKQKLELWTFIPCKLVDGVWVVLEEPKHYSDWYKWGSFSKHGEFIAKECRDYHENLKQAKERCLFKGFELKRESDFRWIFKIGKQFPIMIPKRNIEYLVTILKIDLELTPTAQKQLGWI